MAPSALAVAPLFVVPLCSSPSFPIIAQLRGRYKSRYDRIGLNGRASPANGQHISRPDGGQHTGPGDLQPHLSKLTKHLRGQIVFGLVLKLSC
jgi:hypothetical protein